MNITNEQYLALSALAYSDISTYYNKKQTTIGYLIGNNRIKDYLGKDGSVSPEFSALSTLKDWIIIDTYSNSSSGFYGIAIQDPATKDIVFAYRGTQADILGNDFSPSDIFTDLQIGLRILPQQFVDAVNFYHQVSQTYGSQYLVDYSFTGHSLGGAIAQFMTYSSSTDDKIYDSVTFNAVSPVPIIKSMDADFNKKWSRFYNYSTDHVNSLDWVGMYYGADLGKTIRHINNTEIDYKRVNFEAVSKMLLIKLQVVKGIISNAEGYKRIQDFIKNVDGSISNGSDGYSVEDTLMFYRGQAGGASGELGGGFLDFSHHHLSQFLRDDPNKSGFQYAMTSTVDSQYEFADNSDILQFINALTVIEIAKANDSARFNKIMPSDTPPLGAYSSGGVLYILPDGTYSWGTYSDASIAYAKYIVQKYERLLVSGEFMKSYVDMQKAQAEQNRRIDPLVFDLDGDGITTVSLEESNAFFDLDNNGFAEKTSWVGAKEGLLAYDKNGDGIINGGNELFGDRTLMKDSKTLASSGFTALAEYDNNKDGKIDSNDAIYTLLRIWQDSDGDGIVSAGELKQLVDLGIVSIGLSYNNTGVTDGANNIQVRTGTFTLADGSTRMTGEYLLNRNPVYSVDSSQVEISDDVALLPNVQGAGNVGSLHKAIMQDESGSLRGLVNQFIAEKDVAKREALAEDILARWAGVGSVDPKSRGDAFDARKLAVLEKFFGVEFQGSPNANSAPLLKSSYTKLFEVVYVSLVSQAQLKDVVNSVTDDNDEVSFEKAKQIIDDAISRDSVAGVSLLSEFVRAMKYYGLKSSEEFIVLRSYYVGKSAEYGRIIDFAGEQVLRGTASGDSLSVGSQYTLIDGDSGNDTLIGNTGNDTLIGGQGKDTLRGGYGDDTYIFNKGDGVDYIEEDRGDNDTIQFGEGITLKDLKFFRYDYSGRNLYITVGDNGDAISIKNYFNDGNYSRPTDTFKVEKLLFSDGTTIDAAYIYEKVRTITGSRDGDVLSGHDDQDNILHGLDGNDTIYGGIGNDLLYGDAGDDTLIGNTGNDTLIGGQGKDTLRGGYGDDTYIFNKGDGVDYIEEDRGDNDTIQFGEGITLKDLKFFRYDYSGRNLYITVGDNGDAISIKNYFNDGNYSRPTDTFKVEKLLFSDGTTIDAAYIYEKVRTITGSRDGDVLSGHDDQDNILHGLDGNDTIYGGIGNDLLYGDAGDDTLIGNTGNDTLIGGQGKDTLRGGYGDDTYIFNKGDGVDYIEEDRGDNDTIQFGEGITLKDLKFFRYDYSGRNLYITVGDNGDAISIKNYFNDGNYSRPTDTFKVEKLLFSDGTTIDAAYIYEKVRTITGSRDGDVLSGHDDQDNILHGLDGNDTIYGGIGNDLLYGDAGDDTLIGNTGNDTLIGGQGKDTLRGGYGDDTYIFNKGDGVDYIEEDRGDNDTIQFGEGITLKDLKFFRYDYSGRNLYITVGDNGDAISIKNYFNDGNYSRPTDTFKVEKLLFSDGTTIDAAYIYEKVRTITGSRDGDVLSGHDDQDNILHGLDGNDTIYGGIGNDLLYGDAGDDTLIGNTGNDTLIGGQGKDTLRGGYGDDTYIFNKGDGVDYIEEDRGDNDTIQFGEGITLKDLKFFRYDYSGRNLYITVGDNGDAISIKNYFNDGNYSRPTDTFKVEKLLFSDGTTIDAAYIYEKVRTITGSRDGDVLSGHDDQDNILHGLDGNDTIYGGIGNDLLYGDAGDDTLIGNTGNDTLIGGQGKDTLRGGYGDDTYIFNKGDGVDYIEEDRGDNDTIQFGEGITLKDLKFFRYDYSGRNLYITVGDNGDAISIKNYFNDGNYSRPTDTFKVEKLLFSDGTTIDAAYIYEKVRTITGSRDGDVLSGHDDQDNILHGLDGNDTIYGGIGNDLLYGDAGDDTLIGNTGNDTLIGGQGKDTLRGGYGDDTYIFNKGDGVDRIYDMNGLADEVRLKHKLQDVIFERRSDDLVVYMPGSLDSVVIDSWYRGDNYKIETFTSEDGKFITHTQIESLIQAMSTFQKDTGMTWQQALSSQPSQVESIVTQYWTAPTA